MKKEYFIPRKDLEKQLWLQNFANKLPSYSTKYGIATADVTDITNSSVYFAYWLTYKNLFEEYAKKLTQFKNELRDGTGEDAPSQTPIAPTVGVAPTAVAPGIFIRVISVVNIIKAKTNYAISDGVDMGIEGTEVAGRNVGEMKPVFTLRLANGGHPEIVWSKNGMDGIHIYVNRGTGWLAVFSNG